MTFICAAVVVHQQIKIHQSIEVVPRTQTGTVKQDSLCSLTVPLQDFVYQYLDLRRSFLSGITTDGIC